MSNFYQVFLDEIYNIDYDVDSRLKDAKFRKFIIEKQGKTIETIEMFKTSLSATLKKPQQLIYFDYDFYMASDLFTSTYYICYKNLLMIDVDLDPNGSKEVQNRDNYLDFIRNYCSKHPEFVFEVYQTRKGFHLFVIHQEFDYKQKDTIKLMLELKTDFYYIIYSYIRGFCVRLNRKIGESSPIYSYVGRIGNGKPVERLESLTKLHINSTELYSNHELSQMK